MGQRSIASAVCGIAYPLLQACGIAGDAAVYRILEETRRKQEIRSMQKKIRPLKDRRGQVIQKKKQCRNDQGFARIGRVLVYTALVLFAAVLFFPILFAVDGAFMHQWELEEYLGPVLGGTQGMASWTLLPKAPTLQPLVGILLDSPQFFVMFWNSMRMSVGIVAGQLLFGVPAAWGLSRFDFSGKKLVLLLYIVLMLMPFQVLMLPEYLVLDDLHLLDTQWSVILPAVFSTFPVFIMYRFFCGIPEPILEAARIDGAGNVQIFLRIGIPLGAAGIVSAIILGFLEAWNMIEQPMTFLKTKALWPLSLYLPEIGLEEAGAGFAAALMMLIPALLLFLLGQEYLEQGIAAAAVKE